MTMTPTKRKVGKKTEVTCPGTVFPPFTLFSLSFRVYLFFCLNVNLSLNFKIKFRELSSTRGIGIIGIKSRCKKGERVKKKFSRKNKKKLCHRGKKEERGRETREKNKHLSWTS